MRWQRLVAALLVALALSVGVHRAMETVVSPCASLTPDNWFWYWYFDCGKDAAGGGGGGAG